MTAPTDMQVLLGMIAQQNEQIKGLASAVSGIVAERNAPPPAREYTDEDYRERPTLMVEKFNQALQQVAAPINEFKQQQARAGMYEQSKAAVRRKDARYDKLWDKIEPALDYAMSQANVDPTEAIVAYHVKALCGELLMNNPNILSEIGNTSMHIPPSPPAPPTPPAPVLRELTDNEKVIAKSRGWSAEQFLAKQAESAQSSSMVVTRGPRK